MNIEQVIADKLGITTSQAEKTINLLDEGNTVPFIARYRKEITGNLSDEVLRKFEELLNYSRNLEKRREEILRLIDEQGKLDDELKEAISKAETLQSLEDIYLPYKPKRKTRASEAKRKGLHPLANFLLEGNKREEDILNYATSFINEEEKILTGEDALKGAMDIIAEDVSENATFRNMIRVNFRRKAILTTKGVEEKDIDKLYEMYYDFSEKVSSIAPHRILAVFRGEKEGALKLGFLLEDEENIKQIRFHLCKNFEDGVFKYIDEAVKDGYKRLLLPSIETEIKNELKEKADESSINVFGNNLKPYIMQPPIYNRVIIGLDPGYRTGCKVAVISELGEVLDHANIYPAKPFEKVKEAEEILKKLIEKHNITLFAIGNGTASRETEKFVADLISKLGKKDLHYVIVNESGASIYSASKLGNEEFPNLDVTIRGAISIARRLQDPMAELVKIEPKHIGVGQYQHDVNQKLLNERLENVIEDCVNNVGVDVNTASWSLLSYVAGISKTVAKNIVAYKEENGAFKNRNEFKKVKGLGPKCYIQCAGFLRIQNGEEFLDNTGVHPESYDIARKIKDYDLDKIEVSKTAKELNVGEPTLLDIVKELKKPGRDPREDLPKPVLRSDVLSIEDLKEGMVLKGTVRNVVDFGCFVDIGIKNDGLVHISNLSDKFIKNPHEVVKVSDVVDVKIIGIDMEKQKVSLSMKGINNA